MNSMAIELLAPRYAIAWYPWAVQYFFLIAISYATLWLAAPALVFGKQHWLPTARLALLACLTTTLVAPIALLADLHQPLRFWHFYAYGTSSSWMAIGSLILPFYVLAVLALAWLAWRPALQANREAAGISGGLARLLAAGSTLTPRPALVLVGLVTLLLSTGIMLYTGAELAVVKARPLWNTVWLPLMLIATGFITATGLVLLLNRISGMRDVSSTRQMLKVMLGACIVAGLIAGSWLLDGINANTGSVASALESVRHSPAWRSTALWGSLTGVALFGAVLYLLTRPADRRPPLYAWAWLLGLVAIHMGWMFRWVVLMDVQHIARNSAGFHHYGIAAGSSGILGILGTFGLWLAALLLVELFLPWRQARQGGSAADVPPAHPASSAAEGVPSHG